MLYTIKDAYTLGLKVHGSFMVGNPGDTVSTIKTSIKFAKKCISSGLSSISWNVAAPYPGTELWEYALRNGIINTDYETKEKPFFETEKFKEKERIKAIRSARRQTNLYLKIEKLKRLMKGGSYENRNKEV